MNPFKSFYLNKMYEEHSENYHCIVINSSNRYEELRIKATKLLEEISESTFYKYPNEDKRYIGCLAELAFASELDKNNIDWEHPGYIEYGNDKYDLGDFKIKERICDIKSSLAPGPSNCTITKRDHEKDLDIDYVIGSYCYNNYEDKEMLLVIYGQLNYELLPVFDINSESDANYYIISPESFSLNSFKHLFDI